MKPLVSDQGEVDSTFELLPSDEAMAKKGICSPASMAARHHNRRAASPDLLQLTTSQRRTAIYHLNHATHPSPA